MKKFVINFQKANYKKTLVESVTQSNALSFFEKFDWTDETTIFHEVESKGKDCCPPSLYFEFYGKSFVISTTDGKLFYTMLIDRKKSKNPVEKTNNSKKEVSKKLAQYLTENQFTQTQSHPTNKRIFQNEKPKKGPLKNKKSMNGPLKYTTLTLLTIIYFVSLFHANQFQNEQLKQFIWIVGGGAIFIYLALKVQSIPVRKEKRKN